MTASSFHAGDELARDVSCVLGVPIDHVTMGDLVDRIEDAVATKKKLFFSTTNLHFLVRSVTERAFRDSLIASGINVADGMGVVLICQLLGVRVRQVAGADLPEVLAQNRFDKLRRPLSLYFLGGAPGIAERACEAVNQRRPKSLACAGALDPGTGSVEEMSGDSVIDRIDGSRADFLIVALGAAKGQAWLMHNRERLRVPVASHLGATVNYVAGAIPRAPPAWRRLGLEWLWRIGQEPQLKARYRHDFLMLIRLLWSRILPLGLWLAWNGMRHRGAAVEVRLSGDRLAVAGSATRRNLAEIRRQLREACGRGGVLTVDLSGLAHFDLSFLGLLLVAEAALHRYGAALKIAGLPSRLERVFAWAGYP
jgi:N-acetylglucosaminyldiphosphoundecaprenol N-acetyl-beta-D-mannosaminyltransferase